MITLIEQDNDKDRKVIYKLDNVVSSRQTSSPFINRIRDDDLCRVGGESIASGEQ